MKKAGKILVIALVAVVCLSAFGGGISKVIGGISPGGGGVAIAGDATSETLTTRRNHEPALRLKYYDKSVDEQPYIPPDLTPDFGDVTWSTIEELKADAIQNSTDPAYCKITSKEDLIALGDYSTAYMRTAGINFVQTANIDLAGIADDQTVALGEDDWPFQGNYYGCGWRIFNYSLNDFSTCVGLFGLLKNATISGVYLSGVECAIPLENVPVGIFASAAVDTTFDHCYIENASLTFTEASLSKDTVRKTGAFVGEAYGKTKFEYCRVFNSTLTCPAFVGYAAGNDKPYSGSSAEAAAAKLSFYGCVNEAEISNAKYAAPFLGQMHEDAGVTMKLCTNFGAISSTSDGDAGGLICEIPDYGKTAYIVACVNYSDVTSSNYAGGVAARYSGQSLELDNVVNYGKITGGLAAGGLIGRMSLEGGSVNFECNVSAGEVVCENGYAGAFFGSFDIDQEGSGTLFSSGEDVRTLYNFAVPGVDFIGYLSYDGAAATDAQKTALGNNHFFYHNLRVPQDPETLKDGDDADLLFYGFLNGSGNYGFYYSGERFYPGIKSDSGWEFCAHQVAVWGYDDE